MMCLGQHQSRPQAIDRPVLSVDARPSRPAGWVAWATESTGGILKEIAG